MTLIQKSSPNFPLLPRFFDDYLLRDLFDFGYQNKSATNTTVPAVNIIESVDGFTVDMAAPGMVKSDFNIELDNEILTISSQRETEDELKDNDRYTRREFSYQSFERVFNLPKSVVDFTKIEAKYEDGILRIVIPKREEAKPLPPRKIDIH